MLCDCSWTFVGVRWGWGKTGSAEQIGGLWHIPDMATAFQAAAAASQDSAPTFFPVVSLRLPHPFPVTIKPWTLRNSYFQ